MTPYDLLAARRRSLESVIAASAGDKPHLDAFCARLLGHEHAKQLIPGFTFTCPSDHKIVHYEGFPRAAHVGFGLGAGMLLPSEVGPTLIESMSRLRHRQGQMLQSLASDDIALLGLSEGVVCLQYAGVDVPGDLITWLIDLIEDNGIRDHWISRVRDLAGDLLDGRGRLRALSSQSDVDSKAMETALRGVWPNAFTITQDSQESYRAQLLADLLWQEPPRQGDLERASVWLRAIADLVAFVARSLTPSVSDTIRILQDIQHALKRWRSPDRARRKGIRSGTWLIDDEYDVQTLLWAVLYPIFRSELVDETHLPNWGFTEPRLDIGIESLGLIIEAKIARTPSDYKDIERRDPQ